MRRTSSWSPWNRQTGLSSRSSEITPLARASWVTTRHRPWIRSSSVAGAAAFFVIAAFFVAGAGSGAGAFAAGACVGVATGSGVAATAGGGAMTIARGRAPVGQEDRDQRRADGPDRADDRDDDHRPRVRLVRHASSPARIAAPGRHARLGVEDRDHATAGPDDRADSSPAEERSQSADPGRCLVMQAVSRPPEPPDWNRADRPVSLRDGIATLLRPRAPAMRLMLIRLVLILLPATALADDRFTGPWDVARSQGRPQGRVGRAEGIDPRGPLRERPAPRQDDAGVRLLREAEGGRRPVPGDGPAPRRGRQGVQGVGDALGRSRVLRLAMDLAGHGPRRQADRPTAGPTSRTRRSSATSATDEVKDMWTYHAVAAALRGIRCWRRGPRSTRAGSA